jgi:lipooligosaccharide transport system ATP-binding protein
MDEAERLCDRVGILDHGTMIAEDSPRRLIGSQIEAHVVEVCGKACRSGPGDRTASRRARRTDGRDGILLLPGAGGIAPAMQDHPRCALSRAANLEDVFIKLTGRDIRD